MRVHVNGDIGGRYLQTIHVRTYQIILVKVIYETYEKHSGVIIKIINLKKNTLL